MYAVAHRDHDFLVGEWRCGGLGVLGYGGNEKQAEENG
jgi:hypothetical protein